MLKRVIPVLVILFLGLHAVVAQPLQAYLDTSGPVAETETAIRKVEAFIADQQNVKSSKHLARVFHKFQKTFLKEYEAYADFASIFSRGTYDCLTATTLLSHLLAELGYQAEVIETTYHIFIKVRTTDGDVLLETTDRVGGFVVGEKVIADRIAQYRKGETSGDAAYRYHCSVYRVVTPSDLTGLLLYNQSVKAYNRRDWVGSAKQLEAAFEIYPSARCYELAAILLRTLHEHSEIEPEARQACLEYLAPVIVRRSGSVAAN